MRDIRFYFACDFGRRLLLALSVGKYPVSIDALWSSLWAQLTRTKMDTGQLALIRVRLPRTILAVVVGGSLSLSGAVYQGL